VRSGPALLASPRVWSDAMICRASPVARRRSGG
jgi:hypothetical protein